MKRWESQRVHKQHQWLSQSSTASQAQRSSWHPMVSLLPHQIMAGKHSSVLRDQLRFGGSYWNPSCGNRGMEKLWFQRVLLKQSEWAPRAQRAVYRLTYHQPQLMGTKTETKLWVISFWCGLCVLFPFIADGYFSCRRLSCKLENVFLDVCHYGPDRNGCVKWVGMFLRFFLIKWFVLMLLEVWGCWVMLCILFRVSALAKLITRQAFGIKCILSSEACV